MVAVSEEKLIGLGQFLLQTFCKDKHIEEIYIQKNAENGVIDENDEPTILLTSVYPQVRIKLQTKKAVEAEAMEYDGKTKSSTSLFRFLIQSLFPDVKFWVKNNANAIIESQKKILQACLSKILSNFYLFCIYCFNL